ncbi:hypothetical protein ACLOJK_040804 [Asimina triloba]
MPVAKRRSRNEVLTPKTNDGTREEGGSGGWPTHDSTRLDLAVRRDARGREQGRSREGIRAGAGPEQGRDQGGIRAGAGPKQGATMPTNEDGRCTTTRDWIWRLEEMHAAGSKAGAGPEQGAGPEHGQSREQRCQRTAAGSSRTGGCGPAANEFGGGRAGGCRLWQRCCDEDEGGRLGQ